MNTHAIVRDAVRLLLVWFVVLVGVTTWMFLTTDGEPICEGPLIVHVETSDPPQCNTLTEGYEELLPGLLVGTLIVATIARVVIVLVGLGLRRATKQSLERDPLAREKHPRNTGVPTHRRRATDSDRLER